MHPHDLSHRVFVDAQASDPACAQRWNKLAPERMETITHEKWLESA